MRLFTTSLLMFVSSIACSDVDDFLTEFENGEFDSSYRPSQPYNSTNVEIQLDMQDQLDQLYKLQQQNMLANQRREAADSKRRRAEELNRMRTAPYDAAYPPLRDGIDNRSQRRYVAPAYQAQPIRSVPY